MLPLLNWRIVPDPLEPSLQTGASQSLEAIASRPRRDASLTLRWCPLVEPLMLQMESL